MNEKNAVGLRHINISLAPGVDNAIILFEGFGSKRVTDTLLYIRNNSADDIHCGITPMPVGGVDDVLTIPPAEIRLYVVPPMAVVVYISGSGECEIDIATQPLNFNSAPPSAYAQAVAHGYTGTAERFYGALAAATSGAKRYGVSGVGGSATTLTRLWDAVGLTAMVGTDVPNPAYYNSFDTIAPFNRRKCVGYFTEVVPTTTPTYRFVPQSYYGDPDFAEDGTKGDYVAVEQPLVYAYHDWENGIHGISDKYFPGFLAHEACCDKDGNPRDFTYLPCYDLAVKNGKAVSLPGYAPASGNYKSLFDLARTYNAGAGLEPAVVRDLEWLLFTVEYATQNAQSIMNGAVSMPYSNAAQYQATVASTGAIDNNKFILANAGANEYVVGQQLAMGAAPYDETNKRRILSIDVYDANNKAITFDGPALNIPVGYWSSSRPWYTGSCNTVTTPSGSPVSNTSGKYPMRYRYRENIWGSIYSTCVDLFASLEGAGTPESPYKIGWYLLMDPAWYPYNTSKPDASDLASAAFTKLTILSEHVDGYIKSLATDARYPQIPISTVQTGASSATYYCDYQYVINGTQGIRSVRFGGYASAGAYAGPLCRYAPSAPSSAYWYYGGVLFVPQ